MSKLLKSHAVSLPKIKNQQGRKFGETCWAHMYICKESKKIKINNKKGGEKQKKQDSYSTMKNKTYFRLWAFDCDFQGALLIHIFKSAQNIIFYLKFL